MSNTAVETSKRRHAGAIGPRLRDVAELMKPRVMSLVVFTALAGLVAAPGDMDPVMALVALVCIAAGAGASGALNMWYDADIDAVMTRTASRPVPRGRISAREALVVGLALSVASVFALGILINWTASALLALTIFYYVAVYTVWLKRSTPQNIVIGGAAGAFPPMIGWAAATGSISLEPFVLFLIIFLWTPPHFWALALNRSADYEDAGVPMMPVVRGAVETRRQIMAYSIALVPVAALPWVMGFAGTFYGVASLLLGARFLQLAWRVYRPLEGQPCDRAQGRLFGFSILYLFALFAVLLFEHLLALVPVSGI